MREEPQLPPSAMQFVTRVQRKMVWGIMSDLFPHVVHWMTGGLFSFLIKRDSSVPSGFEEWNVFRQGLKGSFKEPRASDSDAAHTTQGAIVITDDVRDLYFLFFGESDLNGSENTIALHFYLHITVTPHSCLHGQELHHKSMIWLTIALPAHRWTQVDRGHARHVGSPCRGTHCDADLLQRCKPPSGLIHLV